MGVPLLAAKLATEATLVGVSYAAQRALVFVTASGRPDATGESPRARRDERTPALQP
jgi:hypothetical protein